MPEIRFTATLYSPHPEMGSWTFLDLPDEASKKLGKKGTVKVEGTINGFPFRTSAQPNGKGAHTITVNKSMRDGANATMGDAVKVVLGVAAATKEPKVPPGLAKALRTSAKATKQWNDITPRAREEWIEWMMGAKQDETRIRRTQTIVKRLAAGDRRVYD